MPASFLSLPTELKLIILKYIHLCVDVDIHNTYHHLRQIDPFFTSQISKVQLRKKVLDAENSGEKFSNGHRVCHTCFRVLPKSKLTKTTHIDQPQSYFYGLRHQKQICLDCLSMA